MTTAVEVPYPRAVAEFPEVRQSLLANFDACPLGWSWKNEYESHDWSSYPAAAGQIVHRTLARCLRKMVAERESKIAVEVAIQEFEQTLRQFDVPMLGGEESVVPIPLKWIAEARVCVITWALGTEIDFADVAGVEQRLRAVVRYPATADPYGPQVERVVTGKPDVVLISRDGRHAIVPDWKSGWGVPPERVEREDDGREYDGDGISEEGYFQQRAYGLLLFETLPGLQWVTLREHYVRFATSKKRRPTREVSIHRAKLPELHAEFSALVERFDRSWEAQVWKPSPGSHCENCVMPEQCPILPSLRRDGRVTTPEEADSVGRMITVGEASLKRLRAALRPWTDKHGPIHLRGDKTARMWGPVVSTVTTRPSAEQIRFALANGVDPASLYKTVERTQFGAFAAHRAPSMIAEVSETEQMLLAAAKRQEAARKGAKTRAARRLNGGN